MKQGPSDSSPLETACRAWLACHANGTARGAATSLAKDEGDAWAPAADADK
jgi:hypothetical protein